MPDAKELCLDSFKQVPPSWLRFADQLHHPLNPPFKYQSSGQTFWLSHQRCLFWEEERALIISDLHFGKTGHFRKSGIAVPQTVFKEDLQRLIALIQFFKPAQIIIVGDMFHSESNKELNLFRKWRNDFSQLPFHLVKGNHDILDGEWYKDCNITLHPEEMRIGNFSFRHDLQLGNPDFKTGSEGIATFTFSGHIHPGIGIRGMGKQALSFPCFHFSKSYCTLPAFSLFTGFILIEPDEEDDVFAIVEDELMAF